MSGAGNGITVTITPKGLIRDVTLDGHSIGRFISTAGTNLILEAGDLPVLRFSLVPDEVITQAVKP